MAAGAELTHPFTIVESDFSNDNSSEVSEVKDVIVSDNTEELPQTVNGKPPRHLSVVRHSLGTDALMPPSELVSGFVLCGNYVLVLLFYRVLHCS